MSKVKLTQKQADAIEHQKGSSFGDFQYCLTRTLSGDWFDNFNRPLNDLTAETFARAWIEGYEVEPFFEEGDIVVAISEDESDELFEIETVNKGGAGLVTKHGARIFENYEFIRQATELEKQLFEVGRTEPSLKVGDFIIHREVSRSLVGYSAGIIQANKWLKEGFIDFIYPIEHRIEVGDENDQVI
ncbi:hypothetical protein [Alkalibacillus salilacus]|uniref:Uncharacterized protein n=1 Tax=Alkalibacillus salilacus TaxID=284582 RepID=A0ABT9VD92_9BACI|nr:hypothetical protein [Alkalibacillus salilacus]MDQ0158825.1 hypothetical protein [Alkalibacillus salilacus]